MSAAATSAATPLADRRVWLADMPVDVLGQSEIVDLFDQVVTRGERIVLANLNLHGLYCALTDPGMGALLRDPGSIVHVDGTPILWMARALGGPTPPQSRAGHIDLVPKMLRLCAERGWPVVMVGSDPAGAAENEGALRRLAPGLEVAAFSGFFDLADRAPGSAQGAMIERIRAIRPALLLVGMGMPRQERWIAATFRELDVPVIMPVGGFADYFAGRTRTAPRVLGPLGLEWLFRLVHEPRRLGFRYLVEPFLLAAVLARRTVAGARWGKAGRGGGRT